MGLLTGLTFNFTRPAQTAAATSNVINFQARLENTAGAIVPDGNYNLEFKLYNVDHDGSALWTEDYLNSAGHGVEVSNGYVTVNLGSITAFPSNINWDQQLWLTMNVGGTGGSASWDGEMNPRLQLTALPYAFQAKSAQQLQQTQGSYVGTLSFGTLTANRSISLPDEGGTLCIQNSDDCGFAKSADLGSNYIQLQGSSPGTQQTGSFNISANGILGGTLSVGGNLTDNGQALFKNSANSTSAFRVQNSSSVSLFGVDTTDSIVQIGSSTANANGINLVLNNYSGATDPTGTDGAMYYNTSLKQFRCYQNGGWVNCAGEGGNGVNTVGTLDSQVKSANGAVISGNDIYLQTADQTHPGLVSTGAQTFSGDKTFASSTNSATAFQVQDSNGGNILVADTANSRVGVNTGSFGLTANLNVYNDGASTTQTEFTQNLRDAGINVMTDYVQDAYTDGLFWSTPDNNPTAPKAGIYTQLTNSGSKLLFGTSSSYSAGLTNTALTIGYNGDSVFRNGTNSAAGFQIQNAAGTGVFTVNTSTGATLTSSLYVDSLGSGGTTALCLNGGSQVSTCSGAGAPFVQGGNSFGATAVLGTNDDYGLNIKTNNTVVASFSDTGAATFQNSTDSATAFQVENAAGDPILNVDTTGNGTVSLPQSAYLDIGEHSAIWEDDSNALYLATYDWGQGMHLQGASLFYQDVSQSDATEFSIANSGQALFQNAADSSTAFQVQDSLGNAIFNVDTTDNRVGIATYGNTPAYTLDVGGDINTTGAYRINGNTAVQAVGVNNLFLGSDAGNTSLTGTGNYALGQYALESDTTGNNNFALGYGALSANTAGSNNISIGGLGSNQDGGNNIAIGGSALNANVSGNENVAVGGSALLQSTGYYNTALGYQAGDNLASGSNNVLLGSAAGGNLTSGSSNIIIGTNVNAQSATGSNQLNIGNAIYGDLSTGSVLLKNSTNSTTAFQVQDSGGNNLLNVDTTNGTVSVGGPTTVATFKVTSSTSGQVGLIVNKTAGADDLLDLQNAGSTVVQVDNTGDLSLYQGSLFLPNNYGIYFTDNGGTDRQALTYSSANNLSLVNHGSTGSVQIQNNNNSGNIQFRTGTGQNLVASLSATGQALFQNSTNSATAFVVQNAAGYAQFTVDTSSSHAQVNIGGNGSGNQAELDFYSGGASVYDFGIDARGFDGSTPGFFIYNDSLGKYIMTLDTANGAATFRNGNNTSAAFRVQNASGVNELNIDTSTTSGSRQGIISVGTSNTSATLFVLDTKTSTGDPTGQNGAMYYNSNMGTFRCYQGGAWTNCVGGTPPTLQSAYNGGNTINLASATPIIINGGSGDSGINLTTTSGNTPFVNWDNGTQKFGIRSDSNALHLGEWTGSSFYNNLNINSNGTVVLQNSTNSDTAFQIQNTNGDTILNVDTTHGRVGILAGDSLALDASAGDPGGGVTITNDGGNLEFWNGLGGTDYFWAGGYVFQNTTDSSNAFRVEDTDNNSILTVDTSAGRVALGDPGSTDGTLVFGTSAGSNTVSLALSSNPNDSYTLLLPTSAPAGGQCIKTGLANPSQLVFGSCITPTTPQFVQQATTSNTSNGSSLATTITTSSAGDLLIAQIAVNTGSAVVTSVTDSAGNTWVKADSGAGGSYDSEIWYSEDSQPTNQVTVHVSGTHRMAVNISEFDGVAQSDVLDVSDGHYDGGGDSHATPSITTTVDHDLVLASLAWQPGPSMTGDGSGWNDMTAVTATPNLSSRFMVGSPAGSFDTSWTSSYYTTSSSTIVAFKPAGDGSDYAEDYGTTDPSIDAGDVVALDSSKPAVQAINRYGQVDSKAWIVKASSDDAGNAIGVVSTSPGQVIGKAIFSTGDNPRSVALSGRVPVKVSDENGPVKPGDYLVPSSTPGVAMKAVSPGMTIGQALSGFDGPGQGAVTAFIKNTYYPGDSSASSGDNNGSPDSDYLQNGGDATLGSLTVNGQSTVADLQATGTITAGTLTATTTTSDSVTATSTTTDALSVGGNATVGNLVANGTVSASDLQLNGSATIGGNLTAAGAALFRNTTDSTNAFQIQNSGSTPLFTVDTQNSRVYVGNPTADATGTLLVLDTKNTSGDPAGVNGGMYYNSTTGKFRCYQNGGWRDCLSPWIQITKTKDQDVTNSSTYANDDDLHFNVSAGKVYTVRFNVCYAGNSDAGDYKGEFTFPGAISAKNVSGRYVGTGTGDNAVSSAGTLGGATTFPNNGLSMGTAGAFSDKRVFEGDFTFQPNADGTMHYMFAQNTATDDTAARTCGNSFIEYQAL